MAGRAQEILCQRCKIWNAWKGQCLSIAAVDRLRSKPAFKRFPAAVIPISKVSPGSTLHNFLPCYPMCCSRCGLNTIPWLIGDMRPHITRSHMRDVTGEWRDPSSPSCWRADLWWNKKKKKPRKKKSGLWNLHVCKPSPRPWILSCKQFRHTSHCSRGKILSVVSLWDRYLQTHSVHDLMIVSTSSVVPIGCRKP